MRDASGIWGVDMGTHIVNVVRQVEQDVIGRIRHQKRQVRVTVANRARIINHALFVFLTGLLVADLPVLDMKRRRMTHRGANATPPRIGGAVAVLDLLQYLFDGGGV